MRSEPERPLATGETHREGAGPPVAVFALHRGVAWQSPLDPRQLQLVLSSMCAAAALSGRPLDGVHLHLISDAAMAAANAGHLGCTGPTNVLSFPGAPGMGGSLLLSLDTLDRECLLYGQEPAKHLLRLLAHGMAHLAGLDHGPEMDALCAALEQAAEARLAA